MLVWGGLRAELWVCSNVNPVSKTTNSISTIVRFESSSSLSHSSIMRRSCMYVGSTMGLLVSFSAMKGDREVEDRGIPRVYFVVFLHR